VRKTPDDERMSLETCRVNKWIGNKYYQKLHQFVIYFIEFGKYFVSCSGCAPVYYFLSCLINTLPPV
jgi:hypothetical protein